MPEYLAPGVYVEETSFRSKSIEGVSTTTTGFVGATRYGPVTQDADVITSLGEFERSYAGGGKLRFRDNKGEEGGESDNYVWHAARAFFTEGGKRLYLARIFRPLPDAAGKEDYPPNFENDPLDLNSGNPIEPLYADGHGRRSIGTSVSIRSRFPGQAGNLVVRITVRLGQNILGSEVVPGPSGPVHRPKLGAVMEHDVVYIKSGDSIPLTGFYQVRRDTQKDVWRFVDPLQSLPDQGQTVDELGVNTDPTAGLGDSIYIVSASVTVFSDDRDHDLGTWPDLPLDPAHERNGSPDSIFDRFPQAPSTLSEARSLPIVITNKNTGLKGVQFFEALQSYWIALDTTNNSQEKWRASLEKGVDIEVVLRGGNDGQRPGFREYEGQFNDKERFKTGLKQLEDVEDISIVAAPGCTAQYGSADERNDANATLGALISHAERMRYRIAVLDCPPKQGIGDIRKVRAKIDSKYAALYYPWVRVLDPITRRELDLPPSGFVAGIYARNDINRAVYKAPANEVVNLAIGFEQILNKGQQEVLNPEGINCFRFFEGRGFRLWGARTISSDSEWKYVNLRRYFAYLERSIDKGTQWAVFEPNGDALWASVRRTIEDFLLNEWQSGALLGDKPEKAYFVKCDRSTMTQADLDNGRLICLIGIAPLRPAEFVIFRIGQWTADRKV